MSRRRVVVTGGAGFLGSHVVERLARADWCGEIVVPRSRDYDLRREDAVVRLFDETRPDVVIHLAARVGGIGANHANPATYFYDNLLMGMLVLHHAWRAGVSKFVTVGTVCSYPADARIPFTESDLWAGYPEPTNAPYGIAKKALLVQAQAYRAQYGFNAIYLMPVNLYGPRDNFDLESSHVIPAMVRKFVDAQAEARNGEPEPVVLWGDGSPTREFLYVEDCAQGIVLATERYDGGEPVNLGAGFELAIRDLAQLIAGLSDFQGEFRWDPSRPNGQARRSVDPGRAEREFGWHARTSLIDGLEATIAWYRSQRAAGVGATVQVH